MTAVTASMVKELRDRTGLAMMECKKALTEANGDIELAIDNLRNSVIDELVVTDTIPLSDEAANLGKIRQVSVASMVAETIRRINNEESISAMLDSYL